MSSNRLPVINDMPTIKIIRPNKLRRVEIGKVEKGLKERERYVAAAAAAAAAEDGDVKMEMVKKATVVKNPFLKRMEEKDEEEK
jgi:hypothetical protein